MKIYRAGIDIGSTTVKLVVLDENFNIVFANPNLKLNLILFVASFFIIFCCKNTNEVAPKYVKSTNPIYTLLLAIVFVISVLSITKGSEFIYFNF